MREEILGHRERALDPEPDAATRECLLAHVSRHGNAFLAGLPAGKAFEHPLAERIEFANEPIADGPSDIAEILARVEFGLEQGGLNAASGHHFGYTPGGGIYTSALGDLVAAISNHYSGVWFAARGAVNLEKRLCRWMAELIGFPASADGYLASGGSIATLTAVVAAREVRGCLAKSAASIVVYPTAQTHHCIDKPLAIAGMGRCIVRRIDMDECCRMRAEDLQSEIERDLRKGLFPWLVVSSAGTTDTGAIDPLEELAAIARGHKLWNHVDAAYGGFFLLTDGIRERMEGIEHADSVVLDPHKALFLPYGIGALIVRGIATLTHTFHFDANYMLDAASEADDYSPADVSPELSKHFRGLRMWLPLKIHGVAPFRAALEEKLLLARYAWNRPNGTEGFETGPEPQLSVVTFRYLPCDGDTAAFNRRLHRELLHDGRIFLSTTVLDGTFVLRLAVPSVRTHLEEMDGALDIIEETVNRLVE